MNHIDTRIVRFCAEECNRQRSGEISVANMVDAYAIAMDCYYGNTKRIKPWLIQLLHTNIEPNMITGYRQTPVTINDIAIPFENIRENIEKLCSMISPEDYNAFTAREFYFYFENIHPFSDGNGRVGAILYNWIAGTLDKPMTPPNIFD